MNDKEIEAEEETNREVPSKDEMMKAAVTLELKELMGRSTMLQSQMKTAKTKTKEKYFRRKLQKNNQEAMKMLVALNSMNKK